MTRFGVLTFGSRGDVQPFVAIGAELIRRGHDVAMLAATDQHDFVERGGLRAVHYPFDTRAVLQSPRGQEMLARGRFVSFLRLLDQVTAEHIDEVLPVIVDVARAVDVLLVNPLMTSYAFALDDGRRVMHLFTAPITRTRAFSSPMFGSPRLGPLTSWSHDLVTMAGWRMARAFAARTAALAGVPFVDENCFVRAERMRAPALHMISPALVPRPDDLADHHVFCGDTRLGARERAGVGEGVVDGALLAFLDGGAPPVFFGFGSMPVRDPPATLALIDEVARALDVRALVGAGWSTIPAGAHHEGRTFVVGAFDHDTVLPRCRAAVHHGGAGTTHAALRAGLPAVVCSFLLDQPFWAAQLKRHGVGALVPFPKLSAPRLVAALRPLLGDDVKRRAEALGAALRAEDGVAVAAARIEAFAAALAR